MKKNKIYWAGLKIVALILLFVVSSLGTGLQSARAEYYADNFDDNVKGDEWCLNEYHPGSATLEENNSRLEFTADAGVEGADYVLCGKLLNTSQNFSCKVDWHLSKAIGAGTFAVCLGLVVPSVDEDIVIGAGYGDGNLYFSCFSEAAGIDYTLSRSATDGVVYISYDATQDKLYLSINGFWLNENQAAGDWAFQGLLQGAWANKSVFAYLEGDAEAAEAIEVGDAWFDNFEINAQDNYYSLNVNSYYIYHQNYDEDEIPNQTYLPQEVRRKIIVRNDEDVSGRELNVTNVQLYSTLNFLRWDEDESPPSIENPPIYIWNFEDTGWLPIQEDERETINTYPDTSAPTTLGFDAERNVSTFLIDGPTYQTVTLTFTPREQLENMELRIEYNLAEMADHVELISYESDYVDEIEDLEIKWDIDNSEIGQTYSVWATYYIIPQSNSITFQSAPYTYIREYKSLASPTINNNTVEVPDFGEITVNCDGTLGNSYHNYVRGVQWSDYLAPILNLDIKANGQDGPIVVTPGDQVSIEVSLDPGDKVGQNADWWIAATTPFAPPGDWCTYVYPTGWLLGINLCAQAPLFTFSPFEVLNIVLPSGEYTFYFAVDSPDGSPAGPWYGMNSVEVQVQ